jgi:ABC-type polysaccharide/polyol phosphate export permease
MGFLYGGLFGIDRGSYLPYFTTGMITWSFISLIVNESTQILLESKHYMENIPLPCLVYMFRLILRNIIILAHNLPVYLSVALLYQIPFNFNILWLIPNLIVLCINGICYGTILAFISTRFPDVKAIIVNLLQICFFITPIMWLPSALPERFHLFLVLNPFVYFVNLLRSPLLGSSMTQADWSATGIITALGMLAFAFVMKIYRKRVVFWL